MFFKETGLNGAYIIEIEQKKDERGFFARSFCEKEFAAHNLKLPIRQSNISYNKKIGTLRGIHYQIPPYEEVKLVSCIKGAIYDVIIDLRLDSSTYCKWVAVELKAQNFSLLYIPAGFAHGFQTLADDTIVFYQMSEFYSPESARGIRWDDPLFSINWPISSLIISDKDAGYS
ncbi:MAG: dTDP-4-dehydrorhamnose 3,5-epimerase, partial [Atribacterota bacterium]|nr:dTDP-4-dehydrorhamnose 3,5-epimerase [Atribacterota bacterium]